jgi:hypothetical protein
VSAHTRQALFVAGTVTLLLGALGGSALWLLGERAPPAPYEPTAQVPGGADYVGTLNATEMRSDDAVANATRASLAFQSRVQFYDGPPYRRSLALSPPANASLDATAAGHVTYYGRHESAYGARLVVGNWTAEEAITALRARRNVSFAERTYRGHRVHRSEAGPAVAVLDDGSEGGPVPRAGPRLLAVGNGTAVLDAVAVQATREEGREPSTVSGELRRRYRDTDAGYARFAYRFRPETVPDYRFVGPAVRTVRYVGTSYRLNRTATANGSHPPDVRVRIRITTEDADSADDVRNIMEAGKSFYLFQSSNATLSGELRRTTFGVEGRTVDVGYEGTPRGLRVLVRGLFRNQPDPASLAPPGRAAGAARASADPGDRRPAGGGA